MSYVYLETILINDGSNDNSGKICDAYAQKDKHIRVFHTSNKGISVAKNLVILHSTGNYIGFVDTDDLIHKDMFKFLENIAYYSTDKLPVALNML